MPSIPGAIVHHQRDRQGTAAERRRETLWVSALLLGLLALFFSEPILTGRKLLPADIAFTDPVFVGHSPPGFSSPHNVLLYDQAYQFYPWRAYTSGAIRQGWLPFWNPHIYCGAPFLAEDQPAVFYPVNLVSYALSPADALLFTAVLRLFVAGLATYWYVRTIGRGRFGALVSAVIFTFSGFMVVWLGHPHTNVAAWLPSLFLALEWLARRASRRHVAIVSLVVGIQLTGGHAETALYTLTAGGLYYCFRLLIKAMSANDDAVRMPSILRDLVAFGVAVALGFGLALVQLVPFWQWLQHSAELQFRVGTGGLRASRLGPRYWIGGLLPLVLPNVFGNPTWPGEYRSFFPGWNYVEQTLYVGVIGLALAVTAVVGRLGRLGRGPRRLGGVWEQGSAQVWFHASLGLVALGAALRIPLFDFVNHLPFFNIAAYGRLRLVFAFCVAVLAGLGAGDLFHGALRERALRISTSTMLLLGLAGVLIWALAPGVLVSVVRDTQTEQVQQVLTESIEQAFRISNVSMYWPVLVTVLGALALVGARSARRKSLEPGTKGASQAPRFLVAGQPWRLVLISLVVLDMFSLGRGYHTAMREELAFPETPALQLLTGDPGTFRVVGTNVDLMPNTCMIYGLQDVRGLDFPIGRYRELCLALGGRDWLGYGLLFSEQLDPKLLGLLNVKYILSSSSLDADTQASLRLLGQDGDARVYENLKFLPRAFLVHRVQVHSDPAEVLSAMLHTDFEPDKEIVLERPPVHSLGQEAGPARASSSTVRISSYEASRVTIEVESAANGFLFLSDTFYPDWKAYVDGVDTDIYRANYSFRAVSVESGRHTVEFVYEPGYFRIASMGSALALGAVLVLLLCDRSGNQLQRTQHQGSPADSPA